MSAATEERKKARRAVDNQRRAAQAQERKTK